MAAGQAEISHAWCESPFWGDFASEPGTLQAFSTWLEMTPEGGRLLRCRGRWLAAHRPRGMASGEGGRSGTCRAPGGNDVEIFHLWVQDDA